MAEQTRNSVLAIKEEVTEGTPVLPSAGTDFVALQDGFSMEPAFETLENAEIRASIGASKSITGIEAPVASLSHYVRHSGVEGTAPNYRKLLKAAFGSETVQSTQYDTIAASTTSVIKVDAGEGAQFSRGQALLIKDGVNGYSIRPIHSIATDDLTLGFKLSAAPASGVNLGKAVTYTPVNSGHPSLTLSLYRGNGGALEVMSGARVTNMAVDVTAGELVNASFDIEGVAYHFDPINIGATDIKLDFYDGVSDRVATVTADLYKDPHELAQALQDSMNAQGSADSFTVLYNDSAASAGKFTISTSGATLSLKWNTGANTANTIGDKIGFLTASDDTGATTYTSDNAQSWAASLTPSYDSADPLVAKNNEVFIGDASDNVCFKVSTMSMTLANTKANINAVCAESGVVGSVINARALTVDMTALLERHDAEKFKRFRANDETRMMYAFGTKSGGNWVAGKCGCIYVPTCTISSFSLDDADGLVVLNLSLTGFVDSSGNPEVYLNFV